MRQLTLCFINLTLCWDASLAMLSDKLWVHQFSIQLSISDISSSHVHMRETVPAALCQKKLVWWWYSHVAGHLFVLPAHLRIFYHPHLATQFRYHTVIELYQSAATTLCTIVTILSLSPECYKACMFYPSLIQTHHLITWSPDVVSTECCPAGVRYVRPPHGVVK